METVDFKKRIREIKYITETHMSEEQFKQLIKEKTERAKLYSRAVRKRESEIKTLAP
jgi:hypothetical protein